MKPPSEVKALTATVVELAGTFSGRQGQWAFLRTATRRALKAAQGDDQACGDIAETVAPAGSLWRRAKGQVTHRLARWDHGAYRVVMESHGRLGRPRGQLVHSRDLFSHAWVRVQ